MPQLMFPGDAASIGIEVALLTYVSTPGVIGTLPVSLGNPNITHAVLAGSLYYIYNVWIQQGVDKFKSEYFSKK